MQVSKVLVHISTTTSPFHPESSPGGTQDSSVSRFDWKVSQRQTLDLLSEKKKGLLETSSTKTSKTQIPPNPPNSGFPSKNQPIIIIIIHQLQHRNLPQNRCHLARHLALLWDLPGLSQRPRRTQRRPGSFQRLKQGRFDQ